MSRVTIHLKDGAFLPVTENWIHTQIRSLRRWEPVVYCASRENAAATPVARVRIFDRSDRRPTSLVDRLFARFGAAPPAMAAAIKQDAPSLIHAHFGPSGWAAMGLKRQFSIPLITTFYGYDLTQLPEREPVWRERYRRLFQAGDLFLVEGSHMRRRLIDLGCPREKAAVQHIGIDVGAIPFRPREADGSGEIRILAAATFTEKKGLPYAIEAVGRVQRAHPGWKLRLTIIGDSRGTASDDEEKGRILGAIAASRLRDKVVMLGFRTHGELPEEFHKHHLFLAPSVTARDGNTEGGAPVSILEASASGMPVVATTHCDIPEVVIDGASGCLAPERAPAALADKIEFLAGDASMWPEFGRAGRRRVEESYDSAQLGPCLENTYESVG